MGALATAAVGVAALIALLAPPAGRLTSSALSAPLAITAISVSAEQFTAPVAEKLIRNWQVG